MKVEIDAIENGWLVEEHDGINSKYYYAKTEKEAKEKAKALIDAFKFT